MKLALISDTHGFLPEIPPGMDAVIHAGDIAVDQGFVPNYIDEIYPWAARLGIPVYATFGNHDFAGQEARIPPGQPDNLHFLVDKEQLIGGVKFWFSPWSNRFGNWAYMLNEEGLAAKYARIPDDVEIIVSHGPPKGFGDRTLSLEHAGSRSLGHRAVELPNLRYIITGHIHEARGEYQMGRVKVLNVTVVNEWYEHVHAPIVLEIEEAER